MVLDDAGHWLGTDNDDRGGDRIFSPFAGAGFGHRHTWSNSWTGVDHLPSVPASGPLFEGSGVGMVFVTDQRWPAPYRGTFLVADWYLKRVYAFRRRFAGAQLVLQAASDGAAAAPAGLAARLEAFADGGKALFRPTDLELGPDGALYVTGWGRSYGATHDASGAFTSEGRVFRITPPGVSSRSPRIRKVERIRASMGALVAELGHQVAAFRLAAQDELLRRGRAAVAPLRAALEGGATTPPPTALVETWGTGTLARLEPADLEIDASLARWAQSDDPSRENLRVQALRGLASRARARRDLTALLPVVTSTLTHAEPRLRFEAAQALREAYSPDRALPPAVVALVEAALVAAAPVAGAARPDRLTFYALWSLARDHRTATERAPWLTRLEPALRLAGLLAALERAELPGERVVAFARDPDPTVATLARSWLDKSGFGLDTADAVLAQLARLDHRHVNYLLRVDLLQRLSRLPVEARHFAGLEQRFYTPWRSRDQEVVPEEKSQEIAVALGILGRPVNKRALPLLWDALAHPWPDVRRVAAELLIALPPAQRPIGAAEQAALVKAAGDTRPAVRGHALTLLASVPAVSLAEPIRGRLLELARREGASRDPRVRGPALALGAALGVDLAATLPPPEPVTVEAALARLPGADPERGRGLFADQGRTNCSACHRLEGVGRAVGPDLTELAARADARHVALSILDPSATIVEGYRLTGLRLRDGRALEGLVHDETDAAFALTTSDGREIPVDKRDVVERAVAGVSLMPGGYELALDAGEVADLTAFLLRRGPEAVSTRSMPTPPRAAGPLSPLSFRREPGKVHVLRGGRPLTTFHFDARWPKPFLHPLRVPSGVEVSRGYPVAPRPGDSRDHDWHRGLWLAHGDIDGVDFWRESSGDPAKDRHLKLPLGRMVLVGAPRTRIAAKGTAGSLDARLALRDASGVNHGTLALTFTFRAVGEHEAIDVAATFAAGRKAPLRLGDTEEGLLAVRLAEPFREDRGAVIRNAEGAHGTKAVWGKRSRFVDYSTTIDGQRVGVTIFDHPANPGHPTYWHARGYALNAANPVGERDFTGDKSRDGSLVIPPGKQATFRYRVLLHDGGLEAVDVAQPLAAR
jgi:putative heme-binding domain-containing protein